MKKKIVLLGLLLLSSLLSEHFFERAPANVRTEAKKASTKSVMQTIEEYNKLNRPLDKKIGLL